MGKYIFYENCIRESNIASRGLESFRIHTDGLLKADGQEIGAASLKPPAHLCGLTLGKNVI